MQPDSRPYRSRCPGAAAPAVTRLVYRCLAVIVVSLCSALVIADDSIDELQRQLAAASGSERLGLLNELALAHDRLDPEREISLAREALDLARQLDDRNGEARALLLIGCGLRDLAQHQEALEHFGRAGRIFAEIGEPEQQIECLKNTGWVHENTGDNNQALAAYQEALPIARQIGSKRYEAVLLQYCSVIAIKQNQLDRALELSLQALRLQEELGQAGPIANTRYTIGAIYCELGEYEKGLAHYQHAMAHYRQENDLANLSLVLCAIGVVYEHTGRPAAALAHYQESLEHSTAINDRMSMGHTLDNMAGTCLDLGDVAQAEQRYQQALQIWREVGNRNLVGTTLGNIAAMYLTRGEHEKALPYLEESLQIATEIDDIKLLKMSYENRSEIWKQSGDYRRALEDFVHATELQSQILDIEKQSTITRLQEEFESEQQQQQIELLEKDLEIQTLQLSRARIRTAAILCGFLLLAGLFLLLFRRYLHLLAFWRKRSYISHYQLQREIGSGGMGVVYEATDLLDKGKTVALKVIRDELAQDPVQRKRFLNEAYLVDQLDHPNIIQVYERGEHQQTLYIAMELLSGRPLSQLIETATAPLPLPRCLQIISQLNDALQQIHQQGILHRDVKTDNVMLLDNGDDTAADSQPGSAPGRPLVKLLDFGLARAPSLTRLTTTGEILGTITYLSPEQITLRQLSPACDIYAMGVILYELLTLEKPFLGDNPGEIIRAILDHEPLSPARFRTDLPAQLSSLVMRMLAKAAEQRPDSSELAAAFAGHLQ